MIQGRGGRRRQLGPLGVQEVVLDPLGLDRPEGAEADVERAVDAGDPPRGEAAEDVVGEVEPGRRRGDGPRHLGVEGLVAEPVARPFAPLADVRGQGDLSVPFQSSAVGAARLGPSDPRGGRSSGRPRPWR